jgi:hypothetical protein
MTWEKMIAIGFSAIALALGASGVAQADLVTNGSFESTTAGNGQLGFNTNATDWTTTGYNFIYAPGTADTTGANGQFSNVQLWGPNNGSANGLPATSPDGGNFVAADGNFEVGAIAQTITGLNIGDTYELDFFWAGAQQAGFTGADTDQWQVSFGSETQSTPIVNVASEGFSGWMAQTLDFTADNTSDVLSFLAVSGPSGEPPFVLLDGVSVNDVTVPEPSALALLVGGGLGLGAVRFMRRRSKPATV